MGQTIHVDKQEFEVTFEKSTCSTTVGDKTIVSKTSGDLLDAVVMELDKKKNVYQKRIKVRLKKPYLVIVSRYGLYYELPNKVWVRGNLIPNFKGKVVSNKSSEKHLDTKKTKRVYYGGHEAFLVTP